MNEDRGLYIYVEKCVKNKLSFLFDLGYCVEFVDYGVYNIYSKHNDFKIQFSNQKIKRFFEIRYTRKDAKGESADILSPWIDKGDGHSLINISDYMLFIQKQEIKYLWLNSFEGTFEEKFDQLLDYVVNILQTYLMPVLKGEEWIDVPINWYGTR
jgi:hypothetical protein